MASDRSVGVGRAAVGNVVSTGDHNFIEARVITSVETSSRELPTETVSKELAEIRAILGGLESKDTKKIGRALDDADEEARENARVSKDELRKALERVLGYAKSTSRFATVVTKLAPPLHKVVAWLGDKWAALMTHVA